MVVLLDVCFLTQVSVFCNRKQLEAKARMYENLTKSKDIPEEDGSQVFLVDFQQKVIRGISEKREQERKEV